MERLKMLIEQEMAKQSDVSVVIVADNQAIVGRTVEVMDQCALAGVTKISIAAGKQ
jgi:biopolymer transport protein ExbD